VELYGDWYFMGHDGHMLVGLQELQYAVRTERYYFNPYHDGTYGKMCVGWLYADGSWWLLNPAHDGTFGRVMTGWQRSGGRWYWLDAEGRMATGWLRQGGTWYYLEPSGPMATGWRWVGGAWYYFHPSGAMAANEWVGSYWIDASGAWRG
jgi:glucan-binding YG repeat protein